MRTILLLVAAMTFASVAFGIPARAAVNSYAGGSGHACAVLDGSAKCWGWGFQGQLGTGFLEDSPVPKQVIGLTRNVVEIDAGDEHTCAVVREDRGDSVHCWGKNNFGQVGNGTETLKVTTPTRVLGIGAGARISQIELANSLSCAVVDGGVMCWGWNWDCQLGHAGCVGGPSQGEDVALSAEWVDGLGAGSGVTKISVGQSHSCAIVRGGAMCWGFAPFGKLGDGVDRYNHQAVPNWVSRLGAGAGVEDIAVSDRHTCAIVNGIAQCWGFSIHVGQAGRLGDDHAFSPVYVEGLDYAGRLRKITGGYAHTCVASGGENGADTQINCWGMGVSGTLGNGNSGPGVFEKVPVKVRGIRGTDPVTLLKSGERHSCALVGEQLKCWGWNQFCQLGIWSCPAMGGGPELADLPVDVVFR